jgi:signal transduction histidine kinase
MQSRLALSPATLDAVAVAVVAAVGEAEVWALDSPQHKLLLGVFVLFVALPLWWRRRAPLAALVAVGVAAATFDELASSDAGTDALFTSIAVVVACYSLAAYAALRPAALGGVGVFAFYAGGAVLDNVRQPGTRTYSDLVYVGLLFGGTWGVGRLIRSWRHQARTLQQRTAELEEAQQGLAQAAVAEERTRIAREHHDVIAHSVSVMVVQAGAAEQMLDVDPGRARPPLVTIQDSGRQAVEELRRLLGLLRAGEEASLSPQPSLRHLDTLAGQVRDAGVPVAVRVEGSSRELPPGVDLASYRNVQEALTNTLKHAGPASATVVLRYGVDSLDIDVVDDGQVALDTTPAGTGNGLIGMRDRVSLYGGEFAAGPGPRGGFAVHARLPLGGRSS